MSDRLIQPVEIRHLLCGFDLCRKPARGVFLVSTLTCDEPGKFEYLAVCQEHGDALSQTSTWATAPTTLSRKPA